MALVVIKRPSKDTATKIPNDKQGRRYYPTLLTLDDDEIPIRLKKGKFELAPSSENVTGEQARAMLEECLKTNENKRRLEKFKNGPKPK